LVSFFEEKPLPLPRVVDGATLTAATDRPEVGWVTLEQGEAALLVKDGQGHAWRLSWEQREGVASSERRRALPPGDYEVVGYRIIDRSREAETWHVCASRPRLDALRVRAGEEHALSLDATIRVAKRLSDDQIQMAITGANAAGLSIYRDGRRIPIRYELRGRDGEVLRAGRMNYG